MHVCASCLDVPVNTYILGHVPAIYEPFPRSQYVMSAALALWICWMLPPWEDLVSLGRTGCYLGRYMVL